jgi:hypothetical protein
LGIGPNPQSPIPNPQSPIPKDADKAAVEAVRKDIGAKKDQYKDSLREVKSTIGTELYNRFTKGFVKTRDNAEENEKIAHSEFLFKKLKF